MSNDIPEGTVQVKYGSEGMTFYEAMAVGEIVVPNDPSRSIKSGEMLFFTAFCDHVALFTTVRAQLRGGWYFLPTPVLRSLVEVAGELNTADDEDPTLVFKTQILLVHDLLVRNGVDIHDRMAASMQRQSLVRLLSLIAEEKPDLAVVQGDLVYCQLIGEEGEPLPTDEADIERELNGPKFMELADMIHAKLASFAEQEATIVPKTFGTSDGKVEPARQDKVFGFPTFPGTDRVLH